MLNTENKLFDDRFAELLKQCQTAFVSCDSAQANAAISEIFAALVQHTNEEFSPEDVLTTLASHCEQNSDWEGAEAAYKQMLSIVDRPPAYEAKVHSDLATLYYRVLNRQPEALEHLHRATEAARRADVDILLVNTLQSEAAFLIGEKKLVEARQAIDEAMSYITNESIFNQSRASTLIMRAECARLSGSLVEAEHDLGWAYELLQPLASIELAAGIQSDLAGLWACTARLRQDQNDQDGAIAAWQEAVRLSKHVDSLPHAANIYTRLNLAQKLKDLAQALLRQHQRLLAELGMAATELP